MKRTVLSLAAVTCMAVGLSGCSDSAPTGSGQGAAPPPADNAPAQPIPAPGGAEMKPPEVKNK